MRWFWIARSMPNEGPRVGVNLPQVDAFDPSETRTPIPSFSAPESGRFGSLG